MDMTGKYLQWELTFLFCCSTLLCSALYFTDTLLLKDYIAESGGARFIHFCNKLATNSTAQSLSLNSVLAQVYLKFLPLSNAEVDNRIHKMRCWTLFQWS
jgi:hypothetical protein